MVNSGQVKIRLDICDLLACEIAEILTFDYRTYCVHSMSLERVIRKK